MRLLPVALLMWVAGGVCSTVAVADEPSQASAGNVNRPSDRLMLSANGSTLTDTSGGGGGSVHWLHEMNAGTLIGAGVDYQTIADSHWTYGALRGALIRTGQANARWAFYGDIRQGSGSDVGDSFTYSIVAAGIAYTMAGGLSLQLDDQQIDVDTTHGNLPKLSLGYLWNPRLLTGVSYAHSVSGNLGTDLVSARIDYYGRSLNLLAGGAYGDAAPAVLNLPIGVAQPGRTLREVFVGLSKPFSRAEVMLVTDYQELAGSERVTLTLTYTIHLRPRSEPK